MTDDIVLGAYATQEEADAAVLLRPEPQSELSVVEDGVDPEHPWRIYWQRAA